VLCFNDKLLFSSYLSVILSFKIRFNSLFSKQIWKDNPKPFAHQLLHLLFTSFIVSILFNLGRIIDFRFFHSRIISIFIVANCDPLLSMLCTLTYPTSHAYFLIEIRVAYRSRVRMIRTCTDTCNVKAIHATKGNSESMFDYSIC